jgi:hypothetical protein
MVLKKEVVDKRAMQLSPIGLSRPAWPVSLEVTGQPALHSASLHTGY